MANNKISPLAALNRSEGGKRGVSSLKGYGQPSTIGEFLGGFTGAPRRFSVMDPEAAGMQTARDIGEQASVAGQMFGAMTPFAASAAAAKAGQMMGVSPLTVYHGSPHRFSKFDASKIGTGEGTQAYGRGLYFAESPDVANTYRAMQSPMPRLYKDGVPFEARTYAEMLAEARALGAGSVDEAIKRQAGRLEAGAKNGRGMALLETGGRSIEEERQIFDALRAIKAQGYAPGPGGNLYTVDLPGEKIAKMLDWDKPLSQQPKSVRDALNNLPTDVKEHIGIGKYDDLKGGPDILRPLGGLVGDAKASEILRQAGIPGIRYLDAASRGAKQGTRNFVVFPGEEQNIKMLKIE